MARLIDANEITYYTDEQGFECAYKVDIDNLLTIDPEGQDGGLAMKHIVDRIGKPALLEQTAEECVELSEALSDEIIRLLVCMDANKACARLAHACLKEARRLRGENPTPKTTPECWLAISEELTDLQICIEMLNAAGYHGDLAVADVKRQRIVQRLDEAGK